MRTLLCFSQKGGSGKTTIAVHLAVAAAESGESVLLLDTDPQRSAEKWGSARKNGGPVVAGMSVTRIDDAIREAETFNVTLCIIDSAPHASPEAAQLLSVANTVIVPCRPTAFDLGAFARTAAMLDAASARAYAVLNACPPRAPELEESRRVISTFGLAALDATLGERRSFARAVATGKSVTEFEPDGKAAAEIRNLWTAVRGSL